MDLSAAQIKPVLRIGAEIVRRARVARAKSVVMNEAAPFIGRRTVADLLREMKPEQAARVLRYLESPEFEQVIFTYCKNRMVNWTASHVEIEHLMAGIRGWIRESVRLHVGLDAWQATTIADTLIREIATAADLVRAPTPLRVPIGADVAVASQLAAVALRSSEVLARIQDLDQFHQFEGELRSQIMSCEDGLELPHVRGHQRVPYDDLYIAPEFFEHNRPSDELNGSGAWMGYGRVVVLGNPGAGKSTLARKRAFDIASDPAKSFLPLLVILRRLTKDFKTGGKTLEMHIESRIRESYNLVAPDGFVRYLLHSGRAVIILDGLDELTRVALRKHVVEMIDSFAYLYPGLNIVVTSRKVGYDLAPLDHRLFAVTELMDFDTNQVTSYSDKWFPYAAQTLRVGRPNLASAFLRDSEAVKDIRKSPLMLSLLCSLYIEDRYIPANRADVYKKCAEMLFEKWDQIRDVPSYHRSVFATRKALQTLAWRLLTETQDGRLSQTRMEKILSEHFRERSDEDLAQRSAESFLAACRGRSWVLGDVGSTPGEEIYAFNHRVFMEYFAAEYLDRTCKTAESLVDRISPWINAAESAEVCHLVVQQKDRHDMSDEIVRRLLRGALPADGIPTLSFLANMLSYADVSPATLRILIDQVLAAACQSIDVRLGGSVDLTAAHGSTEPLNELLAHASLANLEMVQRVLKEQFGGKLKSSRSMLFLAVFLPVFLRNLDAERIQLWRTFHNDFAEANARDLDSAGRAEPWYVVWAADASLTSALRLLERRDWSSLTYSNSIPGLSDATGFEGYNSLAMRWGLANFSDLEYERMVTTLVSKQDPWLDNVGLDLLRHHRELMSWASHGDGDSRRAFLVTLCLPFFEWCAHQLSMKNWDDIVRRRTWLGPFQKNVIIRARRGSNSARSQFFKQYRSPVAGWPEFMNRWFRGDLKLVQQEDD